MESVFDSLRRDPEKLKTALKETNPVVGEAIKFITENLPLVRSVINRYRNLDTFITERDLEMEALIAVIDAEKKYQAARGNMKDRTFIYWYLQKHFQSLFRGRDKVVAVVVDGVVVDEYPYPVSSKQKKEIMEKYPGCQLVVKSKRVNKEDFQLFLERPRGVSYEHE